MFSDLGDSLGKLFSADERRKNSRANEAAAERSLNSYYNDKNKYLHALKNVDFQPAYVGDAVGPYKRSDSPAARAYLESMLTGDNPQAAASPWSTPSQQVATQQGFNQRYGGGYDALLARGKADRSTTPWATDTPGEVDDSAIKKVKPYKAPASY